MYFAQRAESHAVLPAFILGLAVARILQANREQQRRFRVVAFALLTPFFFIKSGMNVSLAAVAANLGLTAGLLAVKLLTKGFELVVVGFAGHTNIFGRIMGSTAQTLSRLSPCSVLIVK
jgi:Kef-type K+ transport system membrane component KefB